MSGCSNQAFHSYEPYGSVINLLQVANSIFLSTFVRRS